MLQVIARTSSIVIRRASVLIFGMVALVPPLVAPGCANAEFVPNIDSQSGIRYYRPRPYIVVLEPFPIAAEHVLVPGKVRPDGLVITIDKAAREALASLGVQMPDATAHDVESVSLFLPTSKPPSARTTLTSGGSEQGGPLNRDQVDQLVKNVLEAGTTVDPATAPSGGAASGWIRKGDLAEFRDTVNNLFDIRYLPDFDEDYRLSAKAGLGEASLDAYLMRGWAAQHLGKEVDRTELGQLVFANVQAVVDIARAAGKAALVTSTGGLGAAAVLTSGQPDAEPIEVYATVQPVMLQITVIEHAVPGVYPILKQSEMLTLEMDMIVEAPTQTMIVNGVRTTVSFPPTKSSVKIKALPVLGSIQQPASAAFPVAYRTQKELVVAIAGSGGTASVRGEGAPPGANAQAVAEDLQKQFATIANIGPFDIKATVEARRVKVDVIAPNPQSPNWKAVRREVLLAIAGHPQSKLIDTGPHLLDQVPSEDGN